MQFDNEFSVAKPIDEVWATMLDLERVVPAVPDAKVLETTSDKSVTAEIKIRLGSMSMNYSGPAEIVEQDDAAHRALLKARAKEAGGQGNAEATVEIQLARGGRRHRRQAALRRDRDRQGGADGGGDHRRRDRGDDQAVRREPGKDVTRSAPV